MKGLFLVQSLSQAAIFMPFGGESMDERLKERQRLPYDAMVPDPSWLGETETEVTEDAKTKEIQSDQVQSEGLGL